MPQHSSAPSAPDRGKPDSTDSLTDFFSGWLDSVAPKLSPEPSPQASPPSSNYRRRRITTTEIVRVNRATVRESTVCRQWPPEVVAKFLVAEVIRKGEKSR